MKRYYIIYSGIVQGVGFRWNISTLANKYNLTGYVRNLSNGNVEVEIQGDEVDLFFKESLNQKRFVKIFDYSIKEINLKEDEDKFIVKY